MKAFTGLSKFHSMVDDFIIYENNVADHIGQFL